MSGDEPWRLFTEVVISLHSRAPFTEVVPTGFEPAVSWSKATRQLACASSGTAWSETASLRIAVHAISHVACAASFADLDGLRLFKYVATSTMDGLSHLAAACYIFVLLMMSPIYLNLSVHSAFSSAHRSQSAPSNVARHIQSSIWSTYCPGPLPSSCPQMLTHSSVVSL